MKINILRIGAVLGGVVLLSGMASCDDASQQWFTEVKQNTVQEDHLAVCKDLTWNLKVFNSGERDRMAASDARRFISYASTADVNCKKELLGNSYAHNQAQIALDKENEVLRFYQALEDLKTDESVNLPIPAIQGIE